MLLIMALMFIVLVAVSCGMIRGEGFNPAMALAGVSVTVTLLTWLDDIPEFGYIIAIILAVIAYYVRARE